MISELLSMNEDGIDPIKLLLLMQALSFVSELFEGVGIPPSLK